MKISLKSEKGAITLVVLVAMLFLMAVLMSIYIGIANKAQISAENTKQISKQYNNIEEAEAIYNSYFADTNIIPIYTRKQLEKIGSGEPITINGKIYTFTVNGYYILQNDLDLGGYYDEATGSWIAEEPWVPLSSTFTGTLDGLGHTISGMYINNSDESNQGLFGELKGTVKNVNIMDGYISGLSNIGAIAGKNNGTITNCYDKNIILALSTNNGKVQVDEIWYNSLQDYINGIPAEV